MYASEGNSATLSLSVFAFPKPTNYAWFKNESNEWKRLESSAAIQVINTSLEFNLVITELKAVDYGQYNLRVENGIGDPLSYVFSLMPQGKMIRCFILYYVSIMFFQCACVCLCVCVCVCKFSLLK